MAQSSLKNYFGLLSFLISVLVSFSASGAVRLDNVFIYGTSIPTTDINAKALLQMDSTTQGFLPPRLSGTQRDAITSVPEALAIYNSSTHYLNFWNGSAWKQPVTSGDIVNADIASGAAIAYAKLNLTGDIVDTDISSSAAISRGKIATGTPLSVVINGSFGELGSTTVLGVGFGGTNNAALATTAGGMLYTDGSKFVNMGAGSAGQVPVSTGAGAPIWGTTVGGNFANLIVGDFSNSGAGWTSSGGTFTTVTSGGNFMGVGTANGTWDSSAAAQTLTSPAYTISSGYAGTNGLWRCKVQNPTAATITMGRWDGTTLTDAIAIDPGTTAKYVEIADSFGTAATTTAIRFTSVASNEPLISIADCYIGLNFNLSSVNVITGDTDGGPNTITGTTTNPAKGTTSKDHNWFRQTGQYQDVRIEYLQSATTGSSAGSGDYLFLIPNSCVVDTTLVAANTAVGSGASIATVIGTGYGSNNATSSPGVVTLYDSTHVRIIAAGLPVGSGQFPTTNTNVAYAAKYSVPCVGRTASNAVRADTTPGSWSGYHDSNCGWSTTSTTFVDPAGDSTCTFTELKNINFGTVSSFTVSSNNAPGIVFTPKMSGRYFACASVSMLSNSAQGGFSAAKLTDGNGIELGGTGQMSQPSFGGIGAETCGLIDVSQGVSATVKLQIAALTSQTTSIGNPGITGARSVYWNIFALGQNLPNPMLVNTVFSNTGGQERIERATITGSATTPTVASQSGSWLSTSITRNSGGNYSYTINSGMFSSAPTCFCSCADSTNFDACQMWGSPTTTSIRTNCSNGSTGFDANQQIICMGPR